MADDLKDMPSHLPQITARQIRLGVNIDHVATVRNARGGFHPDPVRAALQAIEAGADGITAHLREDRRHIRDNDMKRLKAEITKPLNFEMAATAEMQDIALAIQPHAVCLVPEKRTERTTEGGLDVVAGLNALGPYIDQLTRAGIRVSLFLEPSRDAVLAAASLKAPVVELHTGAWCHVADTGEEAEARRQLERIEAAVGLAAAHGLEVHAGHGLNYDTARQIARLPHIAELNIGHFLIGEALFISLPRAITTMRKAMDEGRAIAPTLNESTRA
jgi:pyridoxine 5-phosphate synthase